MSKTGKEILEASTVIAVVGASRDPNKAGGSVPAGLQQRGFRIIPINPYADTLFGERVYRSLADVPEKIDMVDVFRSSESVPPILDEALALSRRPDVFWMQQGVRNDAAAAKAEAAGMKVVMDRCPKIEYGRLSGEINWVGVNTRTLSSKRAQRLPGGVQRLKLGNDKAGG